MGTVRKFLPPFIGGEEKVYTFSLSDDAGPLDLTGYTITAQIGWTGCDDRLTFSVGDGIEELTLAPDEPAEDEDPDPQFQIRLTETATECIPIGRGATLLITLVSPDDETQKEGPFGLARAA